MNAFLFDATLPLSDTFNYDATGQLKKRSSLQQFDEPLVRQGVPAVIYGPRFSELLSLSIALIGHIQNHPI